MSPVSLQEWRNGTEIGSQWNAKNLESIDRKEEERRENAIHIFNFFEDISVCLGKTILL